MMFRLSRLVGYGSSLTIDHHSVGMVATGESDSAFFDTDRAFENVGLASTKRALGSRL